VERFDVIVVGAGPAGSVTSHLLASSGVRTLLVDRARFPRDKPCGGGVTLRGARLLPFAIGPVVERQVTTIAFRHPDLGAFAHGGLAPVVLMTQRLRLDAFMAEQASRAGADFRDGTRLRTVELE
jgi:flavin-dependent dehydrogenase